MMTVRGINPAPQMLYVRGHLRKASVMPNISERHMKDLRSTIRNRWIDFVDIVFPSVTITDNHGVKTNILNHNSILTKIIMPFLKLRYSLSISGINVNRTMLGGMADYESIKQIFYAICNEFVTERILNTENDDFKHLLFIFTSDFTRQTDNVRTGGKITDHNV